MNKQKQTSQLLIRARCVRSMAKEVRRVTSGNQRATAQEIRENADLVAKAALLLVASQSMLASKGMDNIDLPVEEIHERVVELEIRLERLIARMVLEPLTETTHTFDSDIEVVA